jgi:hypothetical protein
MQVTALNGEKSMLWNRSCQYCLCVLRHVGLWYTSLSQAILLPCLKFDVSSPKSTLKKGRQRSRLQFRRGRSLKATHPSSICHECGVTSGILEFNTHAEDQLDFFESRGDGLRYPSRRDPCVYRQIMVWPGRYTYYNSDIRVETRSCII